MMGLRAKRPSIKKWREYFCSIVNEYNLKRNSYRLVYKLSYNHNTKIAVQCK